MSSEKTAVLGLHKWVPEDDFLRSEFNENFEGLETALSERLVYGAYTGNDAASRLIELGFRPKVVFVLWRPGVICRESIAEGAIAFDGSDATNGGSITTLSVEDTGFKVYNANTYYNLNYRGFEFHYLALRL